MSEWLDSDLPFHIMRDHHQEGAEILAGMWGARLDTGARERYDGALKKLFDDVRNVR